MSSNLTITHAGTVQTRGETGPAAKGVDLGGNGVSFIASGTTDTITPPDGMVVVAIQIVEDAVLDSAGTTADSNWSTRAQAGPSTNDDAIGSTTTTSLSVSSGASTYAGYTILVDTEQMYVESVSSNTLTVVRGVNGTTAATHSGGATYYRYKYPADVVQAGLDIARTYWRSRDVGQSQILGTNEMQMTYPQNEERMILKKLDHYLNKRETAIYV